MPSTFLRRFFLLRAAAIAALCAIFALAAVVEPFVRSLSTEPAPPATAQLTPLLLFPLVAAPVALALARRQN